jgi:hypothetical protein
VNYVIVIALIIGLGTLLTFLTNMRSPRKDALEDASCHSCSTGGCNSCNFDTLNETLSKEQSPDIHLNISNK